MSWTIFQRVLDLPYTRITFSCIPTLHLGKCYPHVSSSPHTSTILSILLFAFLLASRELNNLEGKQKKEIKVVLVLYQLKLKAD